MITSTLYSEQGECLSGGLELIEQWKRYANEVLWIDIQDEDNQTVSELLYQFGAHSLAVEDALRHRHPPKIEFFDQQLFIVYRGVRAIQENLSYEHQQIAFFVESKLLITVHSSESLGVSKTLKNLDKVKHRTPLAIALHIMRNSSQAYLDGLLDFDGHLSELEDQLQNNGNDAILAELTSYKSKLIKLIRTFKYHLSITRALIYETEEYAFIDKDSHAHLISDLNDRFDRLATLSQMHYDISGDLIDGYLSISAHQLNVTMRVLTVITAIFVPLGFLVGLYGMNFEYIPELKLKYGYFYLIGFMGILSVSLIYLFKRRGWL